MSLEAKLELLTAAVIGLTASIGAMQAPAGICTTPQANEAVIKRQKEVFKGAGGESEAEAPNDQPLSTDTTSGKPSASTGESSSPELGYAKDVRPITLRLSKEKGREVTIAALQRFGVKGAQELDTAQWADYIAHCESVLLGGEV